MIIGVGHVPAIMQKVHATRRTEVQFVHDRRAHPFMIVSNRPA
jgi:hypothetical protein